MMSLTQDALDLVRILLQSELTSSKVLTRMQTESITRDLSLIHLLVNGMFQL
ncbi:hypothetical protein D3C72_66390 [compost metagenome]